MPEGGQRHCADLGVQSSLEELAVHVLILWKHCIGTIGETPQDLLEPVFNHCTAPELAQIEDESRENGRQSPLDVDRHWRRCFAEDLGTLHRPPEAASWRQAYQVQLAFLAEKRQRTVNKLRTLWDDAKKQKQERTLKVIDAQANLQLKRPQAHRKTGATQQAAPTARARLAKKLGMNMPRDTSANSYCQRLPMSLRKPGQTQVQQRSQPAPAHKPKAVLEAVDIWEPSRPQPTGGRLEALTPEDLRRIAKDHWKPPCQQSSACGSES